ncbi:MAG: TIGR00730 family Rossman fold protein [Methylococcaceae bacterium]|nr:TIGR00730 family Rossman fold protein [Methylococcaceae bacterium]
MRNLCVFCGSRAGRRPEYRGAAEGVGHLLASRGIQLVYGGGNVGLMGVVADACLAGGGRVVGVIPESLVGREVAGRAVEHAGLSRLEVVDSMHTRKARMAELADGFIALPGGFGTYEELFEILTWAQLGFHAKPVGLVNVCGYYDPLLALCDQALREEFLSPASRRLLIARDGPDDLLDAMLAHRAEPVQVWVKEAEQL